MRTTRAYPTSEIRTTKKHAHLFFGFFSIPVHRAFRSFLENKQTRPNIIIYINFRHEYMVLYFMMTYTQKNLVQECRPNKDHEHGHGVRNAILSQGSICFFFKAQCFAPMKYVAQPFDINYSWLLLAFFLERLFDQSGE